MTAKEATIGFLKAIIQALEESDEEEDQKPTAIIIIKVKDDENKKMYWQMFIPEGLEQEDVQEAVKESFQHYPYRFKGPTTH